MKNRKIRGLVILVVLLTTAYYLAPLLVPNLPGFWTSKELKLGLDLQGGMQVLLEVDYTDLEISNEKKEEAVKTALEIIRNRIDQFGVSEPDIRRIGKNRIQIQLPGVKDFGRAKDLIGKTALLEFKLIANNDEIQAAVDAANQYLSENYEKYDFLDKFVDVEQVDILSEEGEATVSNDDIFTQLTTASGMPFTVSRENLQAYRNLLDDEDFQAAIPSGLAFAIGKEDRNDPYADRAVYVHYTKAELTGEYLKDASTKIGQGYTAQDKGPYIALTFDKQGAKVFSNVTGQNIGRRLAIVLDNVVYMAPNIESKIPTGEARITGQFTLQETHDLVIVLNAGNLPAPVNVIEERTVGPSLGADSIKAGIMAAIIGMGIVILFMLFYYKLSGLVADIAVIVNVGFILAVMTMLGGTLTVPGIAGMILTIGMAVDANVIIFERIRENLAAGKTVRTAVDTGFSRALVTIVDANITTLITALVLYQFGTGPIKGFAVTLSIGIVGSMFSAIFLAKAIFDGAITNVKRDKLSI
jgi:protein-export membrane protein SecD